MSRWFQKLGKPFLVSTHLHWSKLGLTVAMQDKFRLAYLCLETPRPGQAAHTHVHEIIAGLKKQGWDVELFATREGGASSGTNYLVRLWGYLRVQSLLRRKLGNFDAVYIRSHFAALPLAAAAARRSKPVFQELNGKPADLAVTYPFLRRLMSIMAWSYRRQLAEAAHVFAVTDGLAAWVTRETNHQRVSVIPNAANTDLFRPDGPQEPLDGPYVVFVGGLVSWHGISTMLAAVADPAWPKGVRLVIVGDGVERAQVEAAAAANKSVIWLGRRNYEDVPKIMRGAAAALCVIEDPAGRSATGVAPLKLFEAMACGVPVIVTDLPFQSDLVRRENAGTVIPMANPSALAFAVDALVSDEGASRDMGRRGAEYAREHASWCARAGETGQIMESVLTSRA